LEAIDPGCHQGHGGEAQGKTQENAADENADNHGVISFPLREITERWVRTIPKVNLEQRANLNNSLH